MSGALIVLLVFVGLLVVLALIVIGIYNALVRLRNQVDNAWSQIDVQLKRRHDLIPNLVETARGYMKHERETFEAITHARSQAIGAKSVAETAKAEGQRADALSKFMLVVENYPELKANQNFLALQEELTGTENKIAFARQYYNESVRALNTAIVTLPSMLFVGMAGVSKHDFYEVPDASQRNAPEVGFN